ncbi:hypothetical protein [Streptomyces formicae]|uniref:Large membrane protein n=1 Tax=Streptomyces formicae TaxID=1616117 RepID=A0ABY3WPR6_9ACTN|nr:hypothetical protein [Streptomyces formicae]UNM14638.1 hypothetical protein J4032_27090 [Streptomyces formicae]
MNSTERPPTTTADDGPRRRRSRLAVASVAAAVLLAGGGGAYWATSASDGGSGTAPGARTSPPPLALDGAAETGPPSGIAPGEPDPAGVRYRAAVELPDGPESAPVYRASGTVGAADATRLAAALGVPGTPRAVGDLWKIGAEKDSGGPMLQVNRKAPGTWTFARFGPTPKGDDCTRVKPCPGGGAPPAGTSGESVHPPVSEEAAKKAAAPVLAAVGQGDARLDATQTLDALRVVNADPLVGGLPTYGWTTGITVGADGQVVGGSGQLAKPVKGADYPVTGAQETLKRLNGAQLAKPSIGGCATPVPADKPAAPCEPERRAAPAVTISGAVFGLAVHSVAGRPALVPSWLFEVDTEGDARPYTITHPAVAPEFLKPASTSPPKPEPEPSGLPETSDRQVESYAVSADGRTLTLRFWGGVCSDYSGAAEESATEVRVRIVEKRQDPDRVCIMIAKELTEKVVLDRPLGDRKVLDVVSDQAVPRR